MGGFAMKKLLRLSSLLLAAPLLAAPPAPGPRRVAATGRIEAWREATVRFKSPGRVVRYVRAQGEWAKAGEPVVVLDQDVEKAALAEAEAELFQAEARQQRFAKLRGTTAVSDQELDDVEAAWRLAKARRDRAMAALEERTIRAPFSGRILKTYLEAGESAGAGMDSPLFVIGDTRKLKVVAEVDELDVGGMAPGLAAQIVPDALPELEIPGKVVKVSGVLGRKNVRSDDPRQRLDGKVLEIEIELASDPRLKPGMTVQARLLPGSSPQS
jgi:RND family efflux transporter MFP subunit